MPMSVYPSVSEPPPIGDAGFVLGEDSRPTNSSQASANWQTVSIDNG